MKPKWKDVTTYSRNDKDRTPQSWEIRLASERVVVTRYVGFPPNIWVLSWNGRQQPLVQVDSEYAKREALGIVAAHYSKILAALEKALNA